MLQSRRWAEKYLMPEPVLDGARREQALALGVALGPVAGPSADGSPDQLLLPAPAIRAARSGGRR